MAAGAFDLKAFYARVDGLYRDGRGDMVYRYLADSLAAARRSGDPLAIVAVASELGGVERVRGNLRQAESLYDEALLLHGRMPSPDAVSSANLLINKGDVLVAQGRYAAAVVLFDRAEALLGDGVKTAYQRSAICNNRSAAYREMGEYALARRDLRRAVSLLDLVDGAQDKRAVALVSLAQTLVKEGRLDEARREIDAALRASRPSRVDATYIVPTPLRARAKSPTLWAIIALRRIRCIGPPRRYGTKWALLLWWSAFKRIAGACSAWPMCKGGRI